VDADISGSDDPLAHMRLLVTPAKAGVQSLPLAGTGDDRRDPGNPGFPLLRE